MLTLRQGRRQLSIRPGPTRKCWLPHGIRADPGTITLRVAAKSGTLKVTTADLTSRDDHGTDIVLSAVGPAQATAGAGGTADLVVRGTFSSGAAQITLREDGHVTAVWDFTIELD